MLYIGQLAANAGAGVNNHTTASTFDIPDSAKEIYVESDTDAVHFAIGGGTGTNYDTFACTATTGALLYGQNDPYFVHQTFPVPQLGRSPIMAAAAWVAGASYTAGDRVSNNGYIYEATSTGVSNLYGTGPASVGAVLGDGTVNWRWIGRSEASATPNKSVVRCAIFNAAPSACVVKVWVLG